MRSSSSVVPANPASAGAAHQPEAAGLRLLLQACIRNERAAQKQLYDAYSPAIFGAILRYTADPYLASEMLNEAFFRILTRLEQYRYEGAIEGWMRRIAVHTITDHYRKEKKHDEAHSLPEGDAAASAATIGDAAVASLGYKELLGVVHSLPDTQRAVFNLFVFEDATHKEISALLGISEANSRWHLNDARRRLKEKIAIMNA